MSVAARTPASSAASDAARLSCNMLAVAAAICSSLVRSRLKAVVMHAGAQRLGQHQLVAWPRAALGQNAPWIDHAQHHQAIFRLLVLDRVAAGDHRARLDHFLRAAAQHLR